MADPTALLITDKDGTPLVRLKCEVEMLDSSEKAIVRKLDSGKVTVTGVTADHKLSLDILSVLKLKKLL